ncbi:MAG: Gfo/Idh/MocA family oxidoreductase [Alphaproteobacteria bacterium]|nr:Gfo/Idh/MocA family oxidoreductase [Alphaproteobacteria bacterium]
MPEHLRAGVIGCGFFAANHLHAWRQIDDVELVAVCDIDRAKAEAAAGTHGVPSVYSDAEAMLAAEKLDFVDIVTTMPTHRPIAERAAAHGVPMIVQKPFAPTIEDCRAIVRAAADAAVPLMVHENFRFQTPIKAVRQVMDSGVIGRPFFGRIGWRTAFDVYANQPYLAEEERFLLLDLVIHLFDVDRYLFGEVDQLTCRTQSIKPGIKGEDAATVLLGHENGVTSVVDATYSSRRDPDPFPETLIEIDGTEGSVRLDYGCKLTVVSPEGTERRTVEPTLLPWAEKPWHGVQESVLRTQEHWVECLREGREPSTSGADNLKTYALCEAAYASAAGGRTVDPKDFV